MRNKTVSVKVRGIRKRIEGVLRAVDKGEHGFGNLIVERNGARIIMRGNMVVSVALVDQPKVPCDFVESQNPHGVCRFDGASCNIPDRDAEQCKKVVVVDFIITDAV